MSSYFGYIRVSTPKQGTEGVSLQEQKASIERYAGHHGLLVTRWFEEQETAAKVGRPIWTEMVKLLRRKKANGLLVHKIDRSARNFRDWIAVRELAEEGIDVRFADQSLDLSTRGGRLTADLLAVIASDYITNLREETRKGFYGRLNQGLYPLPAPWGYRNEGKGKPKSIDPVKGPLVRRMFELYATGRYPLRLLREEMTKRGLRNRNGKPFTLSRLAFSLRNSFYMGLIRIQKTDELYEGIHEPLVTKALFDRVQAVIDGRISVRPKAHDFVFRRLLVCRACGYSLIGESKKGHTYYRCHTRECAGTCLREEAVEERFFPLLRALQLLPEESQYFAAKMAELRGAWQDAVANEREAWILRLGQIKTRLARLTDVLVDGAIDRELFEERKAALLLERVEVQEKLAQAEEKASTGPVPVLEFLERLHSAYFEYKAGSIDEKRDLVEFVTSNRMVSGKSVEFAMHPDAEVVAKRWNNRYSRPQRDAARIWDCLLAKLMESRGRKAASSKEDS